VCGTQKKSRRQERVAEIEKSWKSYTKQKKEELAVLLVVFVYWFWKAQVLTSWTSFLTPSQQCQCSDGRKHKDNIRGSCGVLCLTTTEEVFTM